MKDEIDLTYDQFEAIVAKWPRHRAQMDRRDRALMVLRSCLVMEDPDRWLLSRNAVARHLTESELASLAYTALSALPPEIAYEIAELAGQQGGEWLPPMDPNDKAEAMATARLWAAGATQTELKAGAMVAVKSMPKQARRGFFAWAAGEGLS